ncbi:MAG: type II toxin-antitoxin system RelE/ParE family toxin [Armatimonadetes bacterium]|nr:type II toxin-antitoxin system RelE/ParE family toxin [Armatimonadota bacterium]
MTYEVGLTEAADHDLRRLPPDIQRRITQRLNLLAHDPRPQKALPLSGTLRGSWRLRIGNYRASYEIDESAGTVVVWAIGHRSGFYDEALRRRR